MNTANLQLEGLYVAISALMTALRQKNLLTEQEIELALAEAEEALVRDPHRPSELSRSNLDAIAFPIRFLRSANRSAANGQPASFAATAAEVGRARPPAGGNTPQEPQTTRE